MEFPWRVRLGCPKPYNSRHLRLPEHFQNSLPPIRMGTPLFFRSGSREGLSELVMEFLAVLRVFLINTGDQQRTVAVARLLYILSWSSSFTFWFYALSISLRSCPSFSLLSFCLLYSLISPMKGGSSLGTLASGPNRKSRDVT